MVLAALERCGIPQNSRNRTNPGQLPFGYDYRDYRLVQNQAEQGVIRMMQQARAGSLTLRQIALPARIPFEFFSRKLWMHGIGGLIA